MRVIDTVSKGAQKYTVYDKSYSKGKRCMTDHAGRRLNTEMHYITIEDYLIQAQGAIMSEIERARAEAKAQEKACFPASKGAGGHTGNGTPKGMHPSPSKEPPDSSFLEPTMSSIGNS